MRPPWRLLYGFMLVASYVLLTWVLYGESLGNWMSQLPGAGEDGAKNFFTVAYHIAYDAPSWWFSGMNYPQGEHAVYTDNQPLISNFLWLIGGSAAWLPFLVFLSGLVGGLAIYDLFQSNGIPRWAAVMLSLGLVFISPQLYRLSGHYSLAYVGSIPACLWLIWKWYEHRNARYFAAICLLMFLSGFIHPYFLMMLVLFFGAFLLFVPIAEPQNRSLVVWIRPALAVAPLVAFQLFMIVTDPAELRPSTPYGFLVYRATWASVFLPMEHGWAAEHLGGFENSLEGGYYIGGIAWVGLVTGISAWIARRWRWAWTFDRLVLVASLPLLLLALAFPFYIWKLDQLLPVLGPLRQFRAVGRFAFLFFWTVNIFGVMSIWRWIALRPEWQRTAMIVLLCGILAIDVISVRARVIEKTRSGTTLMQQEWLDLPTDYDQYQAILPLPYFHIGSENFRSREVDNLREHAFALSLKTGIPLLSVQMSRTDLMQTLGHLDFVTYMETKPPLVQQFQSDAPLLVLFRKGEKLSEGELAILEHSKPFGSFGMMELRSFELQALDEIVEQNQQNLLSLRQRAKPATQLGDAYKGFDQKPSDCSFAGDGGRAFSRNDWTTLIPKTTYLRSGVTYELSFWLNAGTQQAANTQIWFWERDGEKEEKFQVTEAGDHLEQVIGSWILCSYEFRLSKPGNEIEMLLHRDGPNASLCMDELMLRPVDEHYIRPGILNVDNRFSEPPGD